MSLSPKKTSRLHLILVPAGFSIITGFLCQPKNALYYIPIQDPSLLIFRSVKPVRSANCNTLLHPCLFRSNRRDLLPPRVITRAPPQDKIITAIHTLLPHLHSSTMTEISLQDASGIVRTLLDVADRADYGNCRQVGYPLLVGSLSTRLRSVYVGLSLPIAC